MGSAEIQSAATFIEGLDELPTLSTSAQAVMQALQDPAVSFTHIAGLVQRDPALTARLLKTANSAFYPSVQRVSNLQLALSKLGGGELRQLVMASALLEAFNGAHDGMDWHAYWEHCFASGIATQLVADPGLAEISHKSLGENPFFVAGLVHHLGILVEFLRDPTRFGEARIWAAEHGASLSEGESRVFGFTHAEVGGVLLEHWKLPEDVVHAAFAHHDPESYTGPHVKTVYAVHLSAALCHDLGHSRSYDGVAPWFSEKAFYDLGWAPERIPDLKLRIKEAVDRGTDLGNALLGANP